jgi:DUF1680 family protein
MDLTQTGVKSYSRLRPIPPGHIAPFGWLGDYSKINAEGWMLHYARGQSPMVYGRFWARYASAAGRMSERNETLVACCYPAYFADGLAHFGALFPQSELADQLDTWVARLLASQDADGYIGAFVPEARWQHGNEIFSQSLTMEAMLFRYACTGEPALLEACRRLARLQMQVWYRPPHPLEPVLFMGHGTLIIRPLLKLYALTAEVSYLSFAIDIMARHGRTSDFLTMHDAILNQHDAAGPEHVGFPAEMYEYTGDSSQLIASGAAWDMLAQYHLSVDGTPHGNEYMQYRGPLHNCEHCGTVEWFYASNALARISGEVKYADAAERAMLNAYPAAKSVDGMTVAYMHTPNELVAAEWGQTILYADPFWTSARAHYQLAHEPLCCNVNGPRALPLYIESMVMSRDAGLAVLYYGAYKAQATLPGGAQVTLVSDSDYPFEDQVRLTVQLAAAAEFPLYLRIPGWCSSATLSVNSRAWETAMLPGTFACVRRIWHPGDQVELNLHCPIVLETLPPSEAGVREGGVVVRRGPLTYTLPVKEDWRPFTPPAQGPGHDVVAYRIFPAEGAEWNYALVLKPEHPEDSFTLVRLPVPTGARPWEHSPIGLQVKARKVLNWFMEGDPEHPKTPYMPFRPMRLAEAETTVILVPFGFTHLRMTYLPVA